MRAEDVPDACCCGGAQAPIKRRRCDICAGGDPARSRMATKVTYEDRLAPTVPAFWCTQCYEALHYDQAGGLLYPHRVFPYQVN
jgi:hypothetical protein